MALIPDFADRELLPGDFGTFGLEFWGSFDFLCDNFKTSDLTFVHHKVDLCLPLASVEIK